MTKEKNRLVTHLKIIYNKNGDDMKIKVGVSIRHVHLTEDDYNVLFDQKIEQERPLNQPGQFAAKEKVTLKNGDRVIENVRIIGPCRDYTQVELSRTDAYFLKINAPVRSSGDLRDAKGITIIGPKGQLTKKAAIIADRHIHITKEERELYGLEENEYQILVNGEKSGILGNVKIKEAPNSYFELHLDSDDANAFNIKQDDEVEIVKVKI